MNFQAVHLYRLLLTLQFIPTIISIGDIDRVGRWGGVTNFLEPLPANPSDFWGVNLNFQAVVRHRPIGVRRGVEREVDRIYRRCSKTSQKLISWGEFEGRYFLFRGGSVEVGRFKEGDTNLERSIFPYRDIVSMGVGQPKFPNPSDFYEFSGGRLY